MTATTIPLSALPQTVTPEAARLTLTAAVSRRRAGLAGLLMVFGLLGALFVLAMFHTVLVQGQYEVSQVDARSSERQAELLELEATVAELRSPDRLRAVALFDLELTEAKSTIYLAPSNTAVAEVAAASMPLPENEGLLPES